jgi:hypothetical protein
VTVEVGAVSSVDAGPGPERRLYTTKTRTTSRNRSRSTDPGSRRRTSLTNRGSPRQTAPAARPTRLTSRGSSCKAAPVARPARVVRMVGGCWPAPSQGGLGVASPSRGLLRSGEVSCIGPKSRSASCQSSRIRPFAPGGTVGERHLDQQGPILVLRTRLLLEGAADPVPTFLAGRSSM